MSQPPWPLLSPARFDFSDANQSAKSSRKRPTAPATESGATGTAPIIVFSHLGWDALWQRPQQYLSRFAKRHRVLFVETYRTDTLITRVDLRTPEAHPNVTVLAMHLPAARWDDGAWIDAERRGALQSTLRCELHGRFDHPLLWFYDPMAVVAFAGELDERGIVYDCLDEPSQIRGAPPALIERERKLLVMADIVFCRGQKMRSARLPLNPNTHFFGTGVDSVHFGAALSADLPLAPEIAALGGAPVLGYFGVIDERIDYELIARLADARSDWHILMVGPSAKVNPAGFPQRQNLHWIGSRPYSALPALAKGFAVAMMPFALNAATEQINPTKALEYMAAGRPVVSTAVDEVTMSFGDVARVATSHDEFIQLCQREVRKPSRSRISRGRKLAAANTWEANIAQMEKLIADTLAPVEDPSFAVPRYSPPPARFPRLAYV